MCSVRQKMTWSTCMLTVSVWNKRVLGWISLAVELSIKTLQQHYKDVFLKW